ncbi:hypothetical protein SAMN04488595_101244 [Ralstonia sp. 25mfcol4.1]|uniref:hypothetical protein n=1 Tax=Ralstonia sp. 25mfcol4.1 TaxID=1761899 RepID=UPI0008817074|nr:hypothetical protein [Ralstonia sp. 25mfcol4.1]SDO61944.1 hypothetical protein SAMN04488595_101244 [Ralstonia sp. 25mfcol4.1]
MTNDERIGLARGKELATVPARYRGRYAYPLWPYRPYQTDGQTDVVEGDDLWSNQRDTVQP